MLFVTPVLKQKTSRGECSVYYKILKLGGNINFFGEQIVSTFCIMMHGLNAFLNLRGGS